jgi:hypothetical protein
MSEPDESYKSTPRSEKSGLEGGFVGFTDLLEQWKKTNTSKIRGKNEYFFIYLQ